MLRPVNVPISIITRSDFDQTYKVFSEAPPTGILVDLSDYTMLAELWDLKRTIKYDTFSIDTTRLAEGIFNISLTSDQTQNLPLTGAYDVKVFKGGKEYYIVKGTFSTSTGYSDD